MNNTVQEMPLLEYFTKWFNTAITRMEKKGVKIDITFVQFMEHCVSPRQYASLQKSKDDGWLNNRQSKENQYAYVITWQSYSARSTNVFDKSTACFCTRAESKNRAKPKKGEKLRESHKENIGKALKDKPKSDEHKNEISKALTGRKLSDDHKANLKKPKKGWTEERKAERRAQIAAKKEKN